jgi:acyl-CoA thioesterase-1
LLTPRPDWLFVCLGANDGLRHQPLPAMRDALAGIVASAQAAGVKVALAGMRLPPGSDPIYAMQFAAVFPALADELGVPLLPFLLEGVAGQPALNLPDRLHPNAEGHRVIAGRVDAFLAPLLVTPAD